MAGSKRETRSNRANRADAVLNNEEYIRAEQKAESDVIDAMCRLDLEAMTHEEAAGKAFTLVAKLQATRTQAKTLRRLINNARLVDTD